MFYSVTFAKTVLTQITGTSQKSPFCSQPNSGAAIKQMMSSTAFGKITAVYGHIAENGLFVRKNSDVSTSVLRTNGPKSRLCP